MRNEKRTESVIEKTIFNKLFSEKKYALQFYKVLHPDSDAEENDISYLATDQNSFIQINERSEGVSGFVEMCVKNKYIGIIEVAGEWNEITLQKAYVYYAMFIEEYVRENNLDLFSEKRIKIPAPEFYVFFVGKLKNAPKELKFSSISDNNSETFLSIKANAVYFGNTSDDIISQYATFILYIDDIYRKYRRTPEILTSVVLHCINKGIMKNYLVDHFDEVITIMSN